MRAEKHLNWYAAAHSGALAVERRRRAGTIDRRLIGQTDDLVAEYANEFDYFSGSKLADCGVLHSRCISGLALFSFPPTTITVKARSATPNILY